MRRIAILLSGILSAVALLGVAGCGNNDAVAIVNGEEIQRSEVDERVSQFIPLYEMQGIEVDEEMEQELESQMLDQIITEVVLLQEAERQGFSPSSERVEDDYQQIAGQFDDEDELNAALAAQGLTAASLRNVLAIEHYLEAQMSEADFEVTEEQVQALYEQQSALTEDMPPLEEVREQLVMQLEQQQQGQFVEELIQGLREASDIQVL